MHEAVLHAAFEHSEKRIEVSGNIENYYLAIIEPELPACDGLQQLLESAAAAGHCHDAVAALLHECLAALHVGGDDGVGEAVVAPAVIYHKLRNDTCHCSAAAQCTVGHGSHHTFAPCTIHALYAGIGKQCAKAIGSIGENRVDMCARSSKHAHTWCAHLVAQVVAVAQSLKARRVGAQHGSIGKRVIAVGNQLLCDH